jgi:hypothetical protein
MAKRKERKQPHGGLSILSQSPAPAPWYEGTFFWGCVCTLLAFIITVVAKMTDVRWLLAFAWPFAIGASWAAFRNTRRGIRLLLTITSSVVVGLLLAILYVVLPPSALSTDRETQALDVALGKLNKPLPGPSPGATVMRVTRRGGCSVVIPFYSGRGLPIPSGTGSHSNLYAALSELTIAEAIGADTSWLVPGEYKSADLNNPMYRAIEAGKPGADGGRRTFLAEALQFYILTTIDSLQRDVTYIRPDISTHVTKTEAKTGILTPDRSVISGAALSDATSLNELAKLSRLPPMTHMEFQSSDMKEYLAPVKSNLVLENFKEADGAIRYTLRLQRMDLYRLSVTIESLPILPFMNRGSPAGYKVNVDPKLVVPFVFTVRWQFEFKRDAVDRVQEDEYTKWAEALFAGLTGYLC